jgi:hypothetical protein
VINLFGAPLAVGGPFIGGTRAAGNQDETVQATTFNAGGRPTGFSMLVDRTTGPDKSGTGQMVDQNGDGIYEALSGSGAVNFQVDIITEDTTGDGYGDYVSIPWSQASSLGVDTTDGCNPVAGGDPQIWVPIADTDNDNIPDSIVLDLDGNGTPDPQFLASAIIAGAPAAGDSVPTLGEWATIGAALAIAMVAWLQIRAQGIGA